MYPTCDICKKELVDWVGNIMVPCNYNKNREILNVSVICKACTNQLDASGAGHKWHNYWELSYIKQSTLFCLGHIMENIIADDPVMMWSSQAVKQVYSLAMIAHPELSGYAAES